MKAGPEFIQIQRVTVEAYESTIAELREELARVKADDTEGIDALQSIIADLRAQLQAAEAERDRLRVDVKNLELARDELMLQVREPSAG